MVSLRWYIRHCKFISFFLHIYSKYTMFSSSTYFYGTLKLSDFSFHILSRIIGLPPLHFCAMYTQ
ncbi:hypothetical protein BMR1_02g01940 [Babesia microti strain RI]|uniref:Uncharacterized protein n=1 Tax=Babesia microti (strain RI) TaxID=1133968 RepID=I7IGB0_BABMR|nr:hypothetical protein BMR1_02g01940 [Babesia microti strain RI]CCF73546.1 hypothetical protein BMR1_02g01940 [Babesia microti strain RI]|eukprot:XP_012648155.1 hypothetical protein BMR1_02g01940 [Babesia microti strain RI]